jgi:hypothetical protein
VQNILLKLGAVDRTEATMVAIGRGIVHVPGAPLWKPTH